ncbi:MAG: Cbb3-type cytochrome oxidase, cytochrome c subunit [Pedosphaera sp.]|nr:Cbb3-type cytochrome oxidase, cytochrome c subunit [Pedosphaera sp.]
MPAQSENGRWIEGWRGVGLVAITYIYFLIFAQFGFLKRLADLGITGLQLKFIMGAMATGGIATSLLALRWEACWLPGRRLQAGLFGCAFGAILTLLPVSLVGGMAVSFLIGAALGLLTVTLVTHLKLWIGTVCPLLKIGLGVGLAYFVCNCPQLFEASARAMAVVSAGLCCVGIGLAARKLKTPSEAGFQPAGWNIPPFWLVLGCFTALVWLDSAAFFVIQHTPGLKSETWEGARRLWQNGGVHFLAALGSGVMLNRRGLSATLLLAFVSLACACLLLIEPGRAMLAGLCYPLGVSLYSVALVAYPAYLAPTASALGRSRSAGRLYAVAGWLGSALGIGMAENLRRIPPTFVGLAALLFFAPHLWDYFRERKRELLATAALLLAAWGMQNLLGSSDAPASAPQRISQANLGRQVYISEGCIHCHSQYVRPHSSDEIMWGPVADVVTRRTEEPPLIGNRRQGPDLTEVGNRRSSLWLKAHFMNPAMLSPHSPMPVYAHLFADERGEALLAYVQSLGETDVPAHLEISQKLWRLSDASIAAARGLDGVALLQKYCATCHAADGLTRQTWKSSFRRLPPDFATGPFVYAPPGSPSNWRLKRIAEIIKFGLPGTDMPGHEYLADEEVAAMAMRIVKLAESKAPDSVMNHRGAGGIPHGTLSTSVKSFDTKGLGAECETTVCKAKHENFVGGR